MRTNYKNLAMRDPALAAALGVTAGADFGADYGFGDDDYGFGADAAVAMAPVPKATPQAMAQLWQQHHRNMAVSAKRDAILNPNKGADVKVGRYAFAVNQNIVLGTAASITASGSPDTNIRPQRVTFNAPGPGFIQVSEIKASNVSVSVGGIQDAFDYNALSVGQSLDMPTITPAMKVTVLGSYTGFVPSGFVLGQNYLFCASFKGPASVVPEG